jgi:hypothetical protein
LLFDSRQKTFSQQIHQAVQHLTIPQQQHFHQEQENRRRTQQELDDVVNDQAKLQSKIKSDMSLMETPLKKELQLQVGTPRGPGNESSDVTVPSSEHLAQDTRGMPYCSSIDSFSSIFPRIASLDCFQGLQSLSRDPFSLSLVTNNHDSSSNNNINLSNMFRSPSLECFNGIPRVNSLEQFSNFIANMPPQEIKKPDQIPVAANDKSPKSGQAVHNTTSENNLPAPLIISPLVVTKPPVAVSGIAMPRAASSDKLFHQYQQGSVLPRVPSLDKIPRVASMDRLGGIPRALSSGTLPRIGSTEAFLNHVPSLSNISSFMPSFGSFSPLVNKAGEKNLSIPRNNSLEDLLSLVAPSSYRDNENKLLTDVHKKRKADDVEPSFGNSSALNNGKSINTSDSRHSKNNRL